MPRTAATNRQIATNRSLAVGRALASGRQAVEAGEAGGGSLIDSSGSTLGAVPAINTTRLLTADGQVYFSNGTNWLPFTNPGWPRRDGANDFEFEGTADSLPAGWSNFRIDASVVQKINSTRLSYFIMTATADNQGCFSGVAVTSPTNKRYYAAVNCRTSVTATNNGLGGIFVKQTGATGNVVTFYFGRSASAFSLSIGKWSDVNTFSSLPINVASLIWSFNSPIVLSVRSDGTNYVFEYAQFFGGSELRWCSVWSEAIATFLGSFDEVGLVFFCPNQANAADRFVFEADFLRELAV